MSSRARLWSRTSANIHDLYTRHTPNQGKVFLSIFYIWTYLHDLCSSRSHNSNATVEFESNKSRNMELHLCYTYTQHNAHLHPRPHFASRPLRSNRPRNRRDSNSPPDVAAVHYQCACNAIITSTASKITHMGCKGRLIQPNHHSTKMENAAIYITVSVSLQLSFHAASSHDQRRH